MSADTRVYETPIWDVGMCVIDKCGDEATEQIGEVKLCAFHASHWDEIVENETAAGRDHAQEMAWKDGPL